MPQPKLYIQTNGESYPGTQITKEDYPELEELADFRESWGGRKFRWGGEDVRVQGDTIIRGRTPFRVLHVVPRK